MTTPAPPRPVPRGVRAMFVLRQAQRRQWPTALRTAGSVAIPALIGWLSGDLSTGLLASLGGFAALYGGGRPYVNRARLLLVVALAQAAAVSLGIWAQTVWWLGVLTVTVIAVLATVLCNAFNIQPGAYQIALSCAAGTAMHSQGMDPVRTGVLVLCGGLLAGVLSLSGAILDPYGPEREAVSAAAGAVAAYLESPDERPSAVDSRGRPLPVIDLDERRHRAALAMHHAWVVLVNQQPHRTRTPLGLAQLQEISRQLQLLLADAMRRHRPDPDAAARARRLGRAAHQRSGSIAAHRGTGLPLGRPDAVSLLRNQVRPRSRSLLVVVRVAVAALVSGALGQLLGISHSFWVVAAAVLVLSQGFDQRRTVQRGLERTAGTFVGVGLSGFALSAAYGRPLLLIVLVAAALFATQLLVQRNYAAAAIFITCSALLMTGADLDVAEAARLLRARALDTLAGCLVAIVVFTVLSKKTASAWLPSTLADVLDSTAAAVDRLTPPEVTATRGLAARRDLQRQLLRLAETYENGINGFPPQRAAAEQLWPMVVGVERLAYRVLAEGWRLEEVVARTPDGSYAAHPAAVRPPPSGGLAAFATMVRGGAPAESMAVAEVPSFLSRDVADLRRVFRASPLGQ